jgi:hypothetical protein
VSGKGQWRCPKDGGFYHLELRPFGATIVAEDESSGDGVQKTSVFTGLISSQVLLEWNARISTAWIENTLIFEGLNSSLSGSTIADR